MSDDRPTILVLGDQLSRESGALRGWAPDRCRVLMVENRRALTRHRWHRQRAHLVLSAMRHFANDLRDAGFEVDYRHAASLQEGVRRHCDEFEVERVIATQPNSHGAVEVLERLGVDLLRNRLFLTSPDEFESWAADRTTVRMEDFYRHQRRRLHLLMDDDEPIGGRWNLDDHHREAVPQDGQTWPEIAVFGLDPTDREVLADLAADPEIELWGAQPDGRWPATRAQALVRLEEFIDHVLPIFGDHDDTTMKRELELTHSMLSSSLNLGLLHPAEVAYAAEDAFRRRDLPLDSVEGFIRQVIGWREYVWGLYWFSGPQHRDQNEVGGQRPAPPTFADDAPAEMACAGHTIDDIHEPAFTRHIELLKVLASLAPPSASTHDR